MEHTRSYRLRLDPRQFWQAVLDPRALEEALPQCRRFARLDRDEYEGFLALTSGTDTVYAAVHMIVCKHGDTAVVACNAQTVNDQVYQIGLSVSVHAQASGIKVRLKIDEYCNAVQPTEKSLAMLDSYLAATFWRLERIVLGRTIQIMHRCDFSCIPVWSVRASLGLSRHLFLRRA